MNALRRIAIGSTLALASCLGFAALAEEERPQPSAPAESSSEFTTESLRGKVVWLSDALKRRFGVEIDPDAAESLCALETESGEVIPLVKDARGRGFWLDERIRDIDVELMLRRYRGMPLAQVIRVYTIKEGKKYEFDYWCDICAIPMFELKVCECCQGPIRIRERLVEPGEE